MILQYFVPMLISGNRYLVVLKLVFFFIASFQISYSQDSLCTGHLGDNIFTTGDFGSGIPYIYPTDPGYAQGLQYTTTVPPGNGEYTLTNDMTKWPTAFSTWLRIGDNSPDPNGYMMVVNASFASAIFYEQVITDVCENTVYEFSADVINLIRNGVGGHILPNVSFLIDDVEMYMTDPIPQDENWHTYGFTFTTKPGQSSIKLSLRNNAPGGVGNDLALDNLSFRACGGNSSTSINTSGKICESSLFPVLTAKVDADSIFLQWQISLDSGIVFNNIPGATDTTYQIDQQSAGTYFFRFVYSTSASNLTNSNCRIFSDPIMVEVVAREFIIKDTLCEGFTFNLNGIEYGETGIYHQYFTAYDGCDSIVTLDLLVFPDPPIIAEFAFTPPSCIGADDGSISVLSVEGTRPPFIFKVNGIVIPPPSTSLKVPAGTYLVSIENEYGCSDSEEIVVPDGPVLDINTIDDVTIVLGHSIVLETSTNIPLSNIEWTPAWDLDCSYCQSPTATPSEDETYVITAETEGGCFDVDTITVRIDKDPVIYIPNIFSPNNDQVNDFFEITADPLNVGTIDLAIIFDRWGGIMSEQANLFNEGRMRLWDGMTPAGPVNSGLYVYIIKYTTVDGIQRTSLGDVTVIQ